MRSTLGVNRDENIQRESNRNAELRRRKLLQ
jgi:hypothetical protein